MEVNHGLLVIPEDQGDAVIGVQRIFSAPLYWSLPISFLGDKVTSYNGFLRFATSCNGDGRDSSILESPLVQLQAANERIVLEHYTDKVSTSGRYEVRLHESAWVEKGTRRPVSREILMVALQRLERILVRATDFSGATLAGLKGATIDLAVPPQESDRRPLALGVEQCTCPPQYNSSSCQDPGSGYYRWHLTIQSENHMDFVGKVRPCQCNGRSESCHPETGNCLNCRDNTTGSACELCIGGFYGNPLAGEPCQPCQCPNAEHNHATTCSIDSRRQFRCQCQEGYTGPQCDRCDYGYFGNSQSGCFPCNCDPLGSLSDQCDQETGQCFCVGDVTGRDCSQCKLPRRVLTQGGTCKDCNHACLAPLLDTMDEIAAAYDNADVDDIDPAPMLRLKRYRSQSLTFNQTCIIAKETRKELQTARGKLLTLRPHAELTMLEVKKYEKASNQQDQQARDLQRDANRVKLDIDALYQTIEGTHFKTINYATTAQYSERQQNAENLGSLLLPFW